MRFIAKYGRWAIQLREMIVENYATGTSRVLQEPLNCAFEPVGLRPHERELAIAQWRFNGSYQELDEVTTVPPDYRIGVYDTEAQQEQKGWDDETRIWVEEQLMNHADRYDDIITVPRTSLKPPWPAYDVYPGTPAELVHKLYVDGHRVEEVLAYEREMQNRAEIVEALEGALAPADEDEVVVA